jgi:hypothetical protein
VSRPAVVASTGNGNATVEVEGSAGDDDKDVKRQFRDPSLHRIATSPAAITCSVGGDAVRSDRRKDGEEQQVSAT